MHPFLSGFYWGAGFLTALVAFTPVLWLIRWFGLRLLRRAISDIPRRWRSLSSITSCPRNDQLVIESERTLVQDGDVRVLVSVRNETEESWEAVEIEASYFDRDGRFFDRDSEYVAGVISPRSTCHAVIDTCLEEPPDRTELRFVGGQPVDDDE